MALPEVKITFVDGGLAKIPATADGIPLFVGVSNAGLAAANKPVALTPNKDQILAQFGNTPFAQRLLDFVSAGGGIFYAVKTTTNTSAGILTALQSAVDALSIDGNVPFEYIVITTPIDKAIAASISSYLNSLEANDIFTFALVSARSMLTTETVDTYVQNLKTEWQGFTSKKVAVVASYANISNLTGTPRQDSIIGLTAGLISRARVNQHIGEVRSFPLTPITSLQDGINKAHLQFLSDAGFIVALSYNGKKGFYIANDPIFTSPTSDYSNIRNVRTSNKAARILRLMLLEYLNLVVEPPLNADPKNPPPPEKSPTVYDLKLKLEAGLDVMYNNKEIYGYEVVIPAGQNIWSTARLNVQWDIVPTPLIGTISAEHAFKNPLLGGK